MKCKRLLGVGLSLCLLLGGLTACGETQSDMPDLSSLGAMTILAREDGSGTKEEFENLAGTQEKGATAQAPSTQDVEKTLASDKNAIGYAAYGSLSKDSGVRLLSIDGIAPTPETIRDNSYPLCRKYSLAYSGQLTAVENDFLTYILTQGQETVSQDYIPVKKTQTFLSDKSAGQISIAGSSSAAPLVQALAKQYMAINPNAKITVTATDSSRGLTQAIRGDCDLAMSSRALKDYESELLTSQAIAADAIAVAVNADNPLENLSMQQLTAIYDGQYKQWTDLNK